MTIRHVIEVFAELVNLVAHCQAKMVGAREGAATGKMTKSAQSDGPKWGRQPPCAG